MALHNVRLLLLALFMLSFVCPAVAIENITVEVTGRDAASLIWQEKDITVIDLRTAGEFQKGSLLNAVNIDANNVDFEKELTLFFEQNSGDKWFVFCQSGRRSAAALSTVERVLPGTIYHLTQGLSSFPR